MCFLNWIKSIFKCRQSLTHSGKENVTPLQDSDTIFDPIRRIEEQNFQYTKSYLGESFQLFYDFIDLYNSFLELVQQSIWKLKDVHQIPAILHCLQLLRYEAVNAAVTILRGKITDSSSHTRKSIEVCAFITEMYRNAESAERWMKAGASESAKERYKSRFPAWKLVGNLLSQELVNSYETHCLQVHPSFYSLTKRASLAEDYRHTFNYHEIEADGDQTYLVMQFFLLMENHGKIMEFLTTIFYPGGFFDKDKWLGTYLPFIEKWKYHRDNIWKPLIDKHFKDMENG